MKKFLSGLCAAILAMSIAPLANAVELESAPPQRTQIAIVYDTGEAIGSANQHEARPALSLSKLYLGMWVLRNGDNADKAKVENMIRFSEDATASYLDRKYPQAISEVIGNYGLTHSRYGGAWGNSTTSVSDVARFVSAIKYDPVAAPIIQGMRTAAPIAADGYPQNYGTSQLPSSEGTKFGWSDNHNVNGTVSFGPGYVVAASTFGSASDNTSDVKSSIRDTPAGIPGIPDIPGVLPGFNGGAELKQRLRCLVPEEAGAAVEQIIPDNVPIPQQLVTVLPQCR
ncbi:hypothetical protein EML15_00270 [Corynebacterium sp. sy017]|uniref:hypothetical protein n=1 Tax=unclassified Corynebacterium TaxID=2624378 RepID=UPI00118668B7|nr:MULTISPECIES: hypothetical protein [unclassified Corynebacterium]MBP3087589.1 hypothetical protein [Corynebacterium sp. sy017]QDZ42588.1 hypothetical protein FQV43_05000 [Corynebacterium sp. sy039]TSD92162.1 hypothetical protein ELY17_00270 [Corynebacterium sp. SY003]